MPNMEPTSNELHRVVELSSGLRDDQYLNKNREGKNPVEKLKEALSSKLAFQKYYLVRPFVLSHKSNLYVTVSSQELSELAISTYKHIGRIRSARFIGIDLAKFYLLLGQVPLPFRDLGHEFCMLA